MERRNQPHSGFLGTVHLSGSLDSNMERHWWVVSGVLHAGTDRSSFKTFNFLPLNPPRMWQGNETHRGTPGKPGRVATLVEVPSFHLSRLCNNLISFGKKQDNKEETYGVAMELQGKEALDYLNNRCL